MSKAALLQFYNRATVDPALQAEAIQAIEAGPTSVVALGAREGYSFTEEDVKSALSEMQGERELSDDDLDRVSGGEKACSTAFVERV